MSVMETSASGTATPPWLTDLRARASETYEALGWPTQRVEDWRYTRLPERKDARGPGAAGAPELGAIPAAGANRAVLVNGRYRPDLSTLVDLPSAVQIGGLADVLRHDPDLVELYIGRLARLPNMPMTALNTSNLTDGIFVRVPAEYDLEQPLHLVSLGHGDDAAAQHPRILVVLEEGASARIVEHHTGSGSYFTNAISEFDLADGARLEHVKLQLEAPAATHVAGNYLGLGPEAQYEGFVLQTGGTVGRNEVHAYLGSSESDFTLNGVYLAAGRQVLDNTTRVQHAAPSSRSRQTFKGVLNAGARGVFQGKVLVERDAQQTDAHQLSRAVLLSSGAEVDAKPELEIYADDVRCSHGATAGELDEAALFYLESRGIPPTTARHMLVEGFLGETVDEISIEPAKDLIRAEIRSWLEANVDKKSRDPA